MPYDHHEAQSLHTMLLDSKDGYQTACDKTDNALMKDFLSGMVILRTRHADELGARLANAGEEVSGDGSFMSLVHQTIMNVRALFGGLDESALPGFLDGEQRILGKYDEALAESEGDSGLRRTLEAQRQSVVNIIAEIRARLAETGRS